MNDIFTISAKINNLKCIGPEEQGFDEIKPLNLIIGRNNSGKSTLLDLICALTQKKPIFTEVQWHHDIPPKIILEAPITESKLISVFSKGTSGGGIPGDNHWEYAKKYIGARLKLSCFR